MEVSGHLHDLATLFLVEAPVPIGYRMRPRAGQHMVEKRKYLLILGIKSLSTRPSQS